MVFLAAHAKAQDRDQKMWKKVEYAMLVLYLIALVPCYLYSAKFFDVQLGKKDITQIVQKDVDDINAMFAAYNNKSESRCSNYQTELEAMLKSEEGRERIVRQLELDKKPGDLTQNDIEQATESFRAFLLKGREYSSLKSEKELLVKNCDANFQNWNILLMPQYVSELGGAKEKYAKELERIYTTNKSAFEKDAPEFDTSDYVESNSIEKKFTSGGEFSALGLIAVLILGILGLVKYLLGERSVVVPLEEGGADSIRDGGGYMC